MRTEFEGMAELRVLFCFVWGLLEPVEWVVACIHSRQEESKKRNKRKGSESSDFELENG